MLTRRMQVQAVADALAGQPPAHNYRVQQFAEPWRTCWKVLHGTPGLKPQEAILAALKNLYPDDKGRNEIIGAILSANPGLGPLLFPSLAEVALTLKPITWLWEDWIPFGMLTILGAQPGTGKSLLALDLARQIIHGLKWPDGSLVPEHVGGRPVIYVDGECVPQIITERAQTWAVDMTRLFPMLPSFETPIDFGSLPTQETLIEMIYSTKPALIVIDSLGSVNTQGENAVDDVRGILNFLNTVAAEFDLAVLLIHHLRKRPNLPLVPELTFDDFRGSSHIVAMARSVLGLSHVRTGQENDPNGPRKLQVLKTNLTAYPKPIGMELIKLHPVGVLPRYGEVAQPYAAETKADNCQEWLLELLERNGGSMAPKAIVAEAEEAGFSRATVYRARADLGTQITSTAGARDPSNEWVLATSSGDLDEDE